MNGNLKPFERGYLPISPKEAVAKCAALGVTWEAAEKLAAKVLAAEVWLNDEYQVNIDKDPGHGFGSDVVLWHLSIKRRDKAPLHDWRDLQAIKNMLCGEDCEGIELYPASARVVDTANQYHLWVFMPGPNGQTPYLPVGWDVRVIASDPQMEGAVQRPHHDGAATL